MPPPPGPSTIDASPAVPFERRTTALPQPRTTLIGRAEAVADVVDRLTGRSSLVTLVGTGGIGKTRVAVAAAHALRAAFDDRVVFVDLAGIDHAEEAPAAIATALHVRTGAERATEDAIGDALAFRPTLLVVDNVEHVLDAAPLLGRLLDRCPPLRVLATSRARLNLRTEDVVELQPLAAGDASSAAVRLFAERARAVRPSFNVTPVNEASVIALCQRLDGLPLAIEMAASRVALLTPAALLAHLDERTGEASRGRIRLLSTGPGDAPPRHRALHDTIAWSYELLNPPVQALLRQLSVFEGGWTVAAAGAVCSTDTFTVLDGLDALVVHHLVQPDEGPGDDPEPSFRLLETIREFAAAELHRVGTDGEPALRTRHAAFYRDLAVAAQAGLESAEEIRWTRRLEREDANLRVAFAELERTDPAAGLCMAAALGRHWRNSGRWDLGRHLLRRFRDAAAQRGTGPIDRAALADALSWIGRLDVEGGIAAHDPERSQEAADAIEEGLALRRELGEPTGLLRAIEAVLPGLNRAGNRDRAAELCQEGLVLARRIGHRWWQAMLESWLGVFAHLAGNLPEAERAARTCRALAEADGNAHMAGLGGWVLSSVLLSARRPGEAEPLLWESIRDNLASGDRRSASFCYLSLGSAAIGRGELRPATEHFREGLLLAEESSDWVGAGFALALLCGLAARTGQPDRAAELWGSIRNGADQLFQVMPAQRRSVERALTQVRATLGEARFEIAARVGEELGWRLIAPHALAVTDAVLAAPDAGADATAPDAAPEPAPTAFLNPDRLSRREIDVLRLVASGASNHEIGSALHIAPATVERHAANLYRKIGVRRRVDAAVYAIRNGLTTP